MMMMMVMSRRPSSSSSREEEERQQYKHLDLMMTRIRDRMPTTFHFGWWLH